jgi:hypothetical protein
MWDTWHYLSFNFLILVKLTNHIHKMYFSTFELPDVFIDLKSCGPTMCNNIKPKLNCSNELFFERH